MVIAEIFQNKIQRFVTKAIFIINAVNMLKKDFNVYKDLSWKLKNLNSQICISKSIFFGHWVRRLLEKQSLFS